MKFSVIGCGSIGRRHIRTLLTLGHEVSAYNRSYERREAAAREFGIQTYDSLDELLKNPAHAAVICSPSSLHVDHALRAAKFGLHLFVEKPLSHSMVDVTALLQETRARGLITHVGSNMRFHFGPARIKQELGKGMLGRLLWAFVWGGIHLPDWHPDEDYRLMYSARAELGGGAVLDFIHEQDLILWFFGLPESVAAMTGRTGWLEIETEDMADALLRYSDGLQVNLHIDYLQRPAQRGIRIVGTRGWVEWDLARENVEVHQHETGQKMVCPYPDGYDKQDMYTDQMKYFIDCIESDTASESDLDAGIRALTLALKIKESSDTGKFLNLVDQSITEN